MNKNQNKDFNKIYREKSNQIYTKKMTDEIMSKEKEVVRCQDLFLNFLKNNLLPIKYNRASEYLDLLSEKKNHLSSMWNEQFYLSGLEDCDKIEYKFIQIDNSKYRELSKMLLVFLIKTMKQIDDFTEKLNNMNCMFEIIFNLTEDMFPADEMAKILGLDAESEEIEDRLRDIVYGTTDDEEIKSEVESFFEGYGM